MRKNNSMGGCVVSNNLLNSKGSLKWCFREMPINSIDTGWRFLSDADTDEYLSNPANSSVCSIENMIQIEPAILSILDLPVNSDLTFVFDGKKRYFINNQDNSIIR
ncbi:MAG: DUF2185 domain-containing protein [Eubacterium sp.]